jgi:hypothetical protein
VERDVLAAPLLQRGGLIITVDGCASCAMNGENGVLSVMRAV